MRLGKGVDDWKTQIGRETRNANDRIQVNDVGEPEESEELDLLPSKHASSKYVQF